MTLQYYDIAYFVGLVLALVLIGWLAGSADTIAQHRTAMLIVTHDPTVAELADRTIEVQPQPTVGRPAA